MKNVKFNACIGQNGKMLKLTIIPGKTEDVEYVKANFHRLAIEKYPYIKHFYVQDLTGGKWLLDKKLGIWVPGMELHWCGEKEGIYVENIREGALIFFS